MSRSIRLMSSCLLFAVQIYISYHMEDSVMRLLYNGVCRGNVSFLRLRPLPQPPCLLAVVTVNRRRIMILPTPQLVDPAAVYILIYILYHIRGFSPRGRMSEWSRKRDKVIFAVPQPCHYSGFMPTSGLRFRFFPICQNNTGGKLASRVPGG